MLMKPFSLSLLFALFALFVPTYVIAQDTGDDGEDGEEIIVILDESTHGNGPARSFVSSPFCITLYLSLSLLAVDFTYQIGEGIITLTNLSTSCYSTAHYNSALGNTIVPITTGAGFYCISITAENGDVYIGYFII